MSKEWPVCILTDSLVWRTDATGDGVGRSPAWRYMQLGRVVLGINQRELSFEVLLYNARQVVRSLIGGSLSAANAPAAG